MKPRYAIFATALTLAGCVTGTIVPSGKDSYTLSATRCGFCEPVQGYVTEKASSYCMTLGKNMVVRNITGNFVQPWAPANATIAFSCLSKDDPEYIRPPLQALPKP